MKVDMLGNLNISEIFFYYDEPQIFTCTNKFSHIYLFLLTDMDEREWLATPISLSQLALLKKNRISIKEAYINAEEGFVWRIKGNIHDFYAKAIQIQCNNIQDTDLPDDDLFLDYQDDELIPTETNEILSKAITERRDVFELSLLPNNSHVREIDSEILGETLINAQQVFYSLPLPREHTGSKISMKIKEENTIVAVGCYAASFGIRLMSTDLADLYGKTTVTDTLKMFSELLEAKDNEGKLKDLLKNHSPITTMKYRKLIKGLYKSKLEVKVSIASPNKYAFQTHFNKEEIKRNLLFLEDEINDVIITEALIGTLVGINVSKNTFAFKSIDDESIIGALSTNFEGATFEVPKVVKAIVDKKISWNESTQKEKFDYILKKIDVSIDDYPKE